MFRLPMVVFITSSRVVITLTYEFQISTSWHGSHVRGGGPFCGSTPNVPDAHDGFYNLLTCVNGGINLVSTAGFFLISRDLRAELTLLFRFIQPPASSLEI